MRNKLTDQIRQTIITNFDQGKTVADIATFLNLPKSTVYGVVNIYKDSGRITRNSPGGDRRSLLSDGDKNQIRSWVDENPCITLASLKTKLFDEFAKIVSTTTIDRCLRSFHYTFKRLVVIAERRNSPDVISTRFTYATNYINNIVMSSVEYKIIFIDETGYSVSMRSRYGRSIVGTSPFTNVRAIRSRNISVCAAVTQNELLTFSINNSAFRSESFCVYLNSLFILKNERNWENVIFVLDNASIHKTNEVRNLVTANNCQIMYLPPYSPFLNPIENVFSKWKHLVRSQNPNTEESLFQLIHSCASQISNTDCEGYYRNMLTYIRRSINNEVIND